MKFKELGRSGLNVSVVGFGAWGIGGDRQGSVAYGPSDDEVAKDALVRANQLGVNFFDTSSFYGFGHSEKIIGEVFKNKRHEVIIATKGGMVDGTVQDFSPSSIRRSIEDSLTRLQTDYIDLYQLHSPSLDDLERESGLLPLLHDLQKEGKLRAIGISVRSPEDGKVAINRYGFQVVQLNFNLIDQRAVECGLFQLCEEKHIGVIARTPLCFGFLSGKYSTDSQFAPSDHRSTWSREQIALWVSAPNLFSAIINDRENQTTSQAAIRYCLSYRAITSVIPGMLNRDEVDENVVASDLEPYSASIINKLEAVYQQNDFFVR